MSKIMDELNKLLDTQPGEGYSSIRGLPNGAKTAIRALFNEHATLELEGVKEVLAERARQVAVLEADLAYAHKQIELAQDANQQRAAAQGERLQAQTEINVLATLLYLADQEGRDSVSIPQIVDMQQANAAMFDPPLPIPLRYKKPAARKPKDEQ